MRHVLLTGFISVFLAMAGFATAVPQAVGFPDDSIGVALRSRRLVVRREATDSFFAKLQATAQSTLHGLVYMRRLPRLEERARLASLGLNLLHPIQGRVYEASIARTLNRQQPEFQALVLAVTALEPSDKVEPDLWQEHYDAFAVAGRGNYVLDPDSSLHVLISFYDDVPQLEVAAVLSQYCRDTVRIGASVWRAVTTRAVLQTLAAQDIVASVVGGPPPVSFDNDHTRAAVGADQVQLWDPSTGKALGLGGAGIQVGVFDNGFDQDHDDFRSIAAGSLGPTRVLVSDPATHWHATLVAGIIAGNGWRSDKKDSWSIANGGTAYQWRGMAPEAQLIEHVAVSSDGSWTFQSATLLSYIQNHGLDISNHSYHFEPEGGYGVVSKLYDGLIRGDELVGGQPVPPRLMVFGAGNNGKSDGYFSLRNEMKNSLVVGDWYLEANRIDFYSSLGPTWDGRIKPDLVAPGSFVKTTGYWDPAGTDFSASYQSCVMPTGTGPGPRRNFYGVDCGTSLSAPVVTGLLALVLQQYGISHPGSLDTHPPLPSTLRGIAIHSATDIAGPEWASTPDPRIQAFPGPDFVTGYGMPNAEAAVDIVKNGVIIEDHLDNTCDVKQYRFKVTQTGTTVPDSIKVTLAWDDVASPIITDPVTPRLINDLDLVLIDPTGGRHYPWQLNQTITDAAGHVLADDAQPCGTDVVVTRPLSPSVAITAAAVVPAGFGRDHLNTAEQVVAQSVSGTWKAEVSGFAIAQGPQRYSLIGVKLPMLVFDPHWLCRVYPMLCQRWHTNICQVYPPLCDGVQRFPIHDDTIGLSFRDPRDRAILLLHDLCAGLGVRDGCGDPGRSYDLSFGPAGSTMSIEVFSGGGTRISGDSIGQRPGRFRFIPRRDETYVLVLTPPRDVRVGLELDLPIAIRVAQQR